MMKYSKIEGVVRWRIPLVALLVLTLFFVGGTFFVRGAPAFTSPEAKFTDTSASGLAIVPASCPSDPHYVGQCDEEPPPEPRSNCNIYVDPVTISAGETSQLSWNTALHDFLVPPSRTVGSISPDIGQVPRQGVRSVSPVQSTTYVYSGQHFFGIIPGPTFSCWRRLAVRPASCAGTIPSDANLCAGDDANLDDSNKPHTRTLAENCSDPVGSAPKCEYTCAEGYEKVGNVCEPTTPHSCTGVVPAHAQLCLRDGIGLSRDTPRTLVLNCGAPKCQYQCDIGYHLENGQCIPNPTQCNSYNECRGKDLWRHEETLPAPQCTPKRDYLLERCAFECAYDRCIPPPQPQGTIQAKPSLVRQNSTTIVSWSASFVNSCTVTGTNGNSWSGFSSGAATCTHSVDGQGCVSTPITAQTVYTLSCVGLDDSSLAKSVTVNIVPIIIEQ